MKYKAHLCTVNPFSLNIRSSVVLFLLFYYSESLRRQIVKHKHTLYKQFTYYVNKDRIKNK